MQSRMVNERLLAKELAFVAADWDERVARVISQAASPPVLGLGASLLVAYHLSTRQA